MAAATGFARLKRGVAVLLVLAAIAIGGFLGLVQQFASQPLRLPADGATVVIAPGDHFSTVLAKLRAAGVGQGNDLEWKVLATTMRVASRLQAGEYLLSRPLTPRDLLLKFARGDVVRYKFTVVEGWSFREMRAAMLAEPNLAHDSASLSASEIMARLGRADIPAEGRFLPETYFYTRGSSDLDLLGRAAKDMDEVLGDSWKTRDADLPLTTPGELLTLASIVEKETGQASERPRIAGVFVRRLRIGMRLQTDPTVIYGLGSSYDGNIRKTDLETDTPYNTYTRAGLPPTPIAMPGKAAIEAAAHPTKSDALYCVASGRGEHVFSATLEEHNANVRKYQLKR
jgi:UPF0755 protein